MNKTIKKIWNIVTNILVTIVVIFAIALVGVRLIGVDVYTVLLGSMLPTYVKPSVDSSYPVIRKVVAVGDILH